MSVSTPAITPQRVADRAIEVIAHEGSELSGNEWQQALRADPAGLHDELVDAARSTLHDLAGPMRSKRVTIYRAINSPEDAIRWDKLGIYWAYDESYAVPYWGKGKHGVRLRAAVSHRDIDWLTSLALHALHSEGELRLQVGAPIEVVALDDGTGWRAYYVKGRA